MSLRMVRMALAAALAIAVIAVPGTAQAASQFEGTVTAKNSNARTFTLKQDEGGGTFTFKVTADTKFQRISGFGAIKVGASGIEVNARRDGKRLIAIQVEKSGKSGGGGGADDGPNHN